MPSRHAVLEVSPSRLELTVLAGRSVEASKCQRFSFADYNDTWPAALAQMTTVLTGLVEATRASGLRTTVIYHAPSSIVLAVPVPASAGGAAATKAAKLALADGSNRSLSDHPFDLERLSTDARSDGPDAPTPQSHMLAITDTEQSTAALADLLENAGLNPVRMLPADSIGFAAAVDAALERSRTSGKCCIAIECGEQRSVLAAATAGHLRFVRNIGIGSEALVDALAREVRANGAPVKLDATQAAAILFRSGLPVRGQPYDAQTGIEAEAALPLVQPVLQRCIVEIRQSLRFGLEEAERGGAQLVVAGIGAAISRLPQLIAEQCGLILEPQSSDRKSSDAPTSTERGLIRRWISGHALQSRLLPSGTRNKITAKRIRRGMLVGFAGAAAAIAYSVVNVRMELKHSTVRLETARANLEKARPLNELNARMIAAQSGVSLARQKIDSKLSSTAAWDAAMAMLAQCTPPSIRIGEAQMMIDKGRAVCRITGHTSLPTSGDSNPSLGPYLEAMSALPIVKSTRLGSTQRAESPNGPIQSFEIAITLVDIPGTGVESGSGIASAPADKEPR